MKKPLQNKFGKGLDLKLSPKTEAEREESLFLDTIDTLVHLWNSEQELGEDYGIDLTSFSQYYYHAIENLIIAKYGYEKADVIWWWVLERFDSKGEIIDLETEDGKSYTLTTSKDLWKFLKKM